MRVRQILSGLDSVKKNELKKLLPPHLSVPEVETHKYPSALLSSLPNDDTGPYAYLGIIAENMLRLPSAEITLESLISVTKSVVPDWSPLAEAKVRKSVTTQPFLDCLVYTRGKLESVLRSTGTLRYEEVVTSGSVEGHPDMWNDTQVFEIKLTGMLKQNWVSFLFQVFAYAALMPSVTDVYLVLPLQKMVWRCEVRTWVNRTKFRDFLVDWSTNAQTVGVDQGVKAQLLCMTHGIGSHVPKEKTILSTVASVADAGVPVQIFLSGPQNSNIKADDADLAAALSLVEKTGARIFVHSQYLINLSNKENKDDWHTKLLSKNLQVTRAFGGKGVVVHVGKSVKLPKEEALDQMRLAIQTTLEDATPECPLLLETPAGQGTELLTDMKEFLDFVESFKTPKIRVCVDTCHVFAAGHDPLEYLKEALKRPGLLKLVHYNDSLGTCGSCVDRHALVGTGHIGFPKMSDIATVCSANKIPMVIE